MIRKPDPVLSSRQASVKVMVSSLEFAPHFTCVLPSFGTRFPIRAGVTMLPPEIVVGLVLLFSFDMEIMKSAMHNF